jgi:hypothetical protein
VVKVNADRFEELGGREDSMGYRDSAGEKRMRLRLAFEEWGRHTAVHNTAAGQLETTAPPQMSRGGRRHLVVLSWAGRCGTWAGFDGNEEK